jgi:hypothetical protein
LTICTFFCGFVLDRYDYKGTYSSRETP